MEQLKWFQKAVVYQIYPRSFKDSNNDGIGDLKGIISRLDYLKFLGVDVLWLSPVYASPNFDLGYDISDYRSINPEYGTMKEMEELISKAKKRGIRIVMDLVINHTSHEHEWFKQSMDRNSPYRDYYYWVEKSDLAKPDKVPNNWDSVFGGSVWEEHDGAYYLHLFSKQQPDLNFHNRKVIEEVKDIIEFWLKKGISGFRCDVINVISKESLENGKNKIALKGSEHYDTTEGCHRILKELRRDVLDKYDAFTIGEPMLANIETIKSLTDAKNHELDMAFSFEHLEVDNFLAKWFPIKFKPKKMMKVINRQQQEIEWNALCFENHDQPRIISRFGDPEKYYLESGKLFALLQLTLRGTPYIFQGQEIGMLNAPFNKISDFKDVELATLFQAAKKLHFSDKYILNALQKRGRENGRTPMQWTSEGGFSEREVEPWIMMNPNTEKINVENNLKDPDSIFSFYQKMIALRKNSPILLEGTFEPILVSKNVYAYKRVLDGKELVVILNISNQDTKVKLDRVGGKVLASTYNRLVYENGKNVLRPYEGLILENDF